MAASAVGATPTDLHQPIGAETAGSECEPTFTEPYDRRSTLNSERSLVALLGSVTVSRAQVPAYRVQRVVDGDTVVLSTIGTVRLIGVDTPETVDPREPVQRFGQESAAFLRVDA